MSGFKEFDEVMFGVVSDCDILILKFEEKVVLKSFLDNVKGHRSS
jgi:hypothetical protein